MFYKRLILLIFLFLALFLPQITLAACPTATQATGGTIKLCNPLTGTATNIEPAVLIGKIINAVLGVVGSIALVMFIYGGFIWMTAAGNQEKVTKGKDILIWATIGLIVIFSSYALVKFVFTGIGATG